VFSGAAEPETPVGHIFPRATALALFAATVGGELEMAVRQRFRAHDAPTGFALDAFASAAAERLAAIVADRYRSIVYEKRVRLGRVLPYSPGYCGWDVKGQAQLFARLRPEDIGIRLNRQCVMQPTKSVSGVLIAGARDVHVFDPGFPFCRACSARACIHRMADVHDLESQI
jgi:cobalamin-dependent methionine synthase I